MSDPLRIALSGLNAATTRIAVSANNVANASTAGKVPATEDGSDSSVFKPQQVVQTAINNGGTIASIAPVAPAFVTAFDPNSPDANANGEIALPNVDLTTEAVNQIIATNAYKANISVIKAQNEIDEALRGVLA